MSVVSLSVPTRNLASLGVKALLHGLNLNTSLQEKDGPTSYVDIAGDRERIFYATRDLGIRILDVTESDEKAGIPEEDEARRIKTYNSLMQGPR